MNDQELAEANLRTQEYLHTLLPWGDVEIAALLEVILGTLRGE